MAQTNLNIRVDEDVKQSADKLFTALGLNMSIAVNVFLRQAIMKGGVPFQITLDDGLPLDFDRSRLRSAIAGLRDGKGKQHDLVEAD